MCNLDIHVRVYEYIFLKQMKKNGISAIIPPMNGNNSTDYGIFARPDKVRGVIAISNLKSGKVLLEKTEDAVKAFRDERFKLDLGIHPASGLQSEYSSIGLELFSIDLVKECGKDEDLDEALTECKEEYLKKGITLYSL